MALGINDNNRLYRAMLGSRRIILLTYSGAELLDLTGPSGVFSTANRVSGKNLYDIVAASSGGGAIEHSCGLTLATMPLAKLTFEARDTILVIGGYSRALRQAMADTEILDQLRSAADAAGRFGSVCTGVFVLAASGLLNARRVATHWAAASQLARLYPKAHCNADALYVNDGPLWTSAGVTTGIDMALAMLERDHGAALKAAVARQLVVYAHRPGHQSQFSDLLAAQAKEDERFSGLTAWLRESVAMPVSIERMADHVGMSPRNFHRRFVESFGQTPAKFFESLRLDAARSLLEARTSVAHVARMVGFQSDSAFRATFKARFGLSPQLYRETWRGLQS